MNKTILTMVFTIAATLILVTAASAQNWRLAADIPFDFNMGDVKMTSGKYTVQLNGNTTLLIQSADNQKSVFTLSNAGVTRDPRSSRLVFQVYGDRYFLSAVSWADGPSRTLLPASLERLTAKNTRSR